MTFLHQLMTDPILATPQWDNFTLPELNNFLTMLNKEEEDYKRRVRQKYTEMRRRIAEQMDQLRPGSNHTATAATAAAAVGE